MTVETHNNNIKAIKSYENNGARLTEINRRCYLDHLDEDQLIFTLQLI